MTRHAQLDLFAPSAPAHEAGFTAELELARRLPPHVLFGTSSWTFPGWAGLVYPKDATLPKLRRQGLEWYARYPLFQTVGIDSSYYRPLSEQQFQSYARQLPEGFRCVMKLPAEVTSPWQLRGSEPNPRFLDAQYLSESVLGPALEHFEPHLGPMVLQFPPGLISWGLDAQAFRLRLRRFFSDLRELIGGLPNRTADRRLQFAVELRDAGLLGPEHFDLLSSFGAAHVFNYWEAVPELSVQLDWPGSLEAAGFAVCRLLIPPGQRYARRKADLAPFNRLVDVRETMRTDVLRLIRRCADLEKQLFVIVNNKAEGSSPLTVRGIAEQLALSGVA